MPTYNSKQSKKPAPNNFLEALRDLGQGTVSDATAQVTKAFTDDLPSAFGLSPASGTLRANEEFSLSQPGRPENPLDRESKSDMFYQHQLMQLREEEQAHLRRQEAQIREQIKSIQEELRTMAKTLGEFSQEVEVATFQATVNPGIYHKNFFTRLKSIIVALRKKASESKSWLAEFNGRAGKRSFYWSQVGKSGTKYMLSSERYMVTSTG